MKRMSLSLLLLCGAFISACGCTSMIVAARASSTGRPLLWKHRDTGADNNFLIRVDAAGDSQGYVGLFNGGDSLLTEAWMGMNDAGFAIMNTASYNLAPDTAAFKDQEGRVMRRALETCRTVADFENLLDSLPKPLGVQANFGLIDALGGAAYFETNDYSWTRFDAADEPTGVLIRTNYSLSGVRGEGSGYIRYCAAQHLAASAIQTGTVSPELLTDTLSRSFYHGLTRQDYLADGQRYVVDQDFIPRNISTATIVIEGVNDAGSAGSMRMRAALGYPPCAEALTVTLRDVPEGFLPDASWRSPACEAAMQERRALSPYTGGSGLRYIDLERLRRRAHPRK